MKVQKISWMKSNAQVIAALNLILTLGAVPSPQGFFYIKSQADFTRSASTLLTGSVAMTGAVGRPWKLQRIRFWDMKPLWNRALDRMIGSQSALV